VALLRRVNARASEHDVDIVAAGLSFYALLGLFPSLLGVVSLYSLVADPHRVQQVFGVLARTLPPQAARLVTQGLAAFVRRSSSDLTFSVVVGFLAVLWSSSSGMGSLVRALNVAFDVKERHSFFERRAIALLFTLTSVIGVVVVVPSITALPKLLHALGAQSFGVVVPPVALASTAFLVLLVLFRYAPYRRRPSFREVAPGAFAASVSWLLVSGTYSFYVTFFARLSSTYGALEGVIVLELWFYLSALVLLYAAELNVELSRGRQAALADGAT